MSYICKFALRLLFASLIGLSASLASAGDIVLTSSRDRIVAELDPIIDEIVLVSSQIESMEDRLLDLGVVLHAEHLFERGVDPDQTAEQHFGRLLHTMPNGDIYKLYDAARNGDSRAIETLQRISTDESDIGRQIRAASALVTMGTFDPSGDWHIFASSLYGISLTDTDTAEGKVLRYLLADLRNTFSVFSGDVFLHAEGLLEQLRAQYALGDSHINATQYVNLLQMLGRNGFMEQSDRLLELASNYVDGDLNQELWLQAAQVSRMPGATSFVPEHIGPFLEFLDELPSDFTYGNHFRSMLVDNLYLTGRIETAEAYWPTVAARPGSYELKLATLARDLHNAREVGDADKVFDLAKAYYGAVADRTLGYVHEANQSMSLTSLAERRKSQAIDARLVTLKGNLSASQAWAKDLTRYLYAASAMLVLLLVGFAAMTASMVKSQRRNAVATRELALATERERELSTTIDAKEHAHDLQLREADGFRAYMGFVVGRLRLVTHTYTAMARGFGKIPTLTPDVVTEMSKGMTANLRAFIATLGVVADGDIDGSYTLVTPVELRQLLDRRAVDQDTRSPISFDVAVDDTLPDSFCISTEPVLAMLYDVVEAMYERSGDKVNVEFSFQELPEERGTLDILVSDQGGEIPANIAEGLACMSELSPSLPRKDVKLRAALIAATHTIQSLSGDIVIDGSSRAPDGIGLGVRLSVPALLRAEEPVIGVLPEVVDLKVVRERHQDTGEAADES